MCLDLELLDCLTRAEAVLGERLSDNLIFVQGLDSDREIAATLRLQFAFAGGVRLSGYHRADHLTWHSAQEILRPPRQGDCLSGGL